jgi:hypothetical protein
MVLSNCDGVREQRLWCERVSVIVLESNTPRGSLHLSKRAPRAFSHPCPIVVKQHGFGVIE